MCREPTVRMGSIAEGFGLHEASGVPRGVTAARVTGDRVYALHASIKGRPGEGGLRPPCDRG